jgi:hypothetical protein
MQRIHGRPMPGFCARTVGTQIALDFQGSDLMWFTGYVGAAEKATGPPN